jgi:hypothetical protein
MPAQQQAMEVSGNPIHSYHMRPILEVKLDLFADYFQFYIQDEKAEGNLADSWTEEADKMLLATTDGTIGVGTSRNMDVPVTIQIFDAEPNLLSVDLGIIKQINECDLKVTSGQIVVAGCTEYFPDAKRIKLDKGNYRSRIYYSNLDRISENGFEGEDFYEIHLWPAKNEQGTKVILDRLANH